MKFDLKKPCKSCPFVVAHDFHLTPERIAEIADAFAFPCHKTVDYDDDDERINRASEQHCFGHLVVQWAEYGGFNKGAAFAAQSGMFDPHALPTPADVGCFETFGEYINREEDRRIGRRE